MSSGTFLIFFKGKFYITYNLYIFIYKTGVWKFLKIVPGGGGKSWNSET